MGVGDGRFLRFLWSQNPGFTVRASDCSCDLMQTNLNTAVQMSASNLDQLRFLVDECLTPAEKQGMSKAVNSRCPR